MTTILGLDIGVASVGFALISRRADGRQVRILRMGVRVFPEGRTEDKQEPRNLERRTARLRRRQLRRRRQRRRQLGDTLIAAGLLPPFDPTPGSAWHKVMAGDPYSLRKIGLDRPLAPAEVGRALYHLAQHRGFWSAQVERPKTKEEEKEAGVVKEAIQELTQALGEQTLGAYLADLPAGAAKRGRHLSRTMIEDEFARFWAAQATHHATVMTEELRRRVASPMFFQRPTYWKTATLGHCEPEPDSDLAARSSYLGQRFVMLQDLNNLRLAGGNARPLTPAERAALLDALEGQKSMTFGAIRKLLKPLWQADGTDLKSKFNFEEDKRKTLPGNAMEADLRAVFGDAWATFPARDRLRHALDDYLRRIHYRRATDGGKGDRIEIRRPDDVKIAREQVTRDLIVDFGVTEAQAQALAAITPAAGWLRHSVAALENLLPHMEAGVGYVQAADLAYPERRKRAGGDDRLSAHPAALPDICNPTVTRALNEMRKVVNNIIAAHGKPDRIHIELARDVKLTPKKLAEVKKTLNENTKNRAAADSDLRQHGMTAPTGRDIEKYLLWEECGRTCPYSGDKIGFDALFRRGHFQVEHIYPYSRSLDNRMANKTLARIDFNQRKGNRSPHEAFAHDGALWAEMTARVKSILPSRKAGKFLAPYTPAQENQDFVDRQLRDTAYAARKAREFLLRLYPQIEGQADPVMAVAGRVTGRLRHFWGLNSLLGTGDQKDRSDYRHNALDALVVALTDYAAVKRISDLAGRDEFGTVRDFPPPWPSYRADIADALATIVPSFRVWAKTSGPLHEETRLGRAGEAPDGTLTLVKRKPVASLTAGEVDRIRDPAVRALIQRRAAAAGGLKAAIAAGLRMPQGGVDGAGPEIKSVRLLIERHRDVLRPLAPAPKTFAEEGSVLHHIALYGDADNVAFTVVTRPEVRARLATGAPAVAPTDAAGRPLIFALRRNDVLEHVDDDGVTTYIVVRYFNRKGQIFHKPIWQATRPKPELSYRPGPLLRNGYRKVAVDPIGRMRPAR